MGLTLARTMRKCFSRRRLLKIGLTGLVGLPALAIGDGACVEPRWLKVNRLHLAGADPVARFVHFTDLHHKGDRKWLASVVRRVNALKPEFVCFSGDLIEDKEFLSEALELLKQLNAPLFGVPGNHDYWSKADFSEITRGFAATGGAWLLDASIPVPGGRVQIHGLTCEKTFASPPQAGVKNVLLAHYPLWWKKVVPHRYDVILAGHSHGGQVRIPFYGPITIPYGCGEFDLGRFDTPAGPLYVGSGIGWFFMDVRFRCRPEITLIEI